MHRIVVPSFLVLLTACGGASSSSSITPSLRVVDANLPYQVLNARTSRVVDEAEFWSELTSAQAICVGKSHDDPHHHWAQLQVVERVFTKSSNVATGMEMFQRPFQGVLDDFAQGMIGEKELLERSDWQGRWNYDWELYAPIVRRTLAKGGKVLALNVSTEL